MKRFSFLLLLIALMAPWAANAQETLTVCDGTAPGTTTTTNCYVPINSYYTDTQGAASEFIIPSTTAGMDELEGGTITKLTFHIPSPPSTWGTPTIQVYMGEVDATTLSSIYGPTNTNVTIVSESVLDNTQSTIEVNLTTPYTYNGGNLLIGTYVKTKSSYSATYFSGIEAPSGSSRYRNNSTASGSAVGFLPKTTFTYTPGSSTATAPGVTTNNTATNITDASVTLGGTITDMGGATGVNAGICYSTTNTPTTNDSHVHSRVTSTGAYTQNITGLQPNTTYYYRAYAYNTANSLADPTYGNIYSFTTAGIITLNQPANGAISASVASGTATTSSTYALPGQSVTLTATVVSGYSFDCWNVTGVTGTATGSTYIFTMPSNNVTATASIVPTSGGSSSEFYYELASSVESGAKYLVVAGNQTTIASSTTFYAMERNNTSSSSGYLAYGTPTFKDTEKHKITDITNSNNHPFSDFVWTITSSGSDYTLSAESEGSAYYMIETSASDGNLHSYTTSNTGYDADKATWSIVETSNDAFVIHNPYWHTQYTSGTRYYYLYRGSSGFQNWYSGTAPESISGASYYMYLYKETSVTTYAIVATASPAEGGTVAGSDYYASGASCTLTATPAFGYDFVSWTENGTVVSTDAEYTFTVSSARTLVANFESQGSCIKPTDVAQVANTEAAHQAQISWTENNEATQWQVVYSTNSDFDPDAPTPITVNDNPTTTITGLDPETTYYVYVRTVCGENSQSGWSNKATFTTISGRQAPTVSYDESTLTDQSVTITWTGVATNVLHQSYDLYYSTDPVMPQTPVQPSFIGNINAESKELTGLTAQTTYYVWVRDNCGADGYSDWSTSKSFTTACGVYTVTTESAYTYGFETSIPFNCWTPVSGTVEIKSSIANSGSYRLDFRGTTSNMIALPQFSNDINTLSLEFYTRPESSGGSSGKFTVGYMTDINDASTFVSVLDEPYNSTSWASSPAYEKKTVFFSNVPAGAYIAMRQYDCSTNYYWYVDDVTVKIPVIVTADQIVNTVTDPATEMTWDEFAQHVNNGDNFTHTTFTLMDDITVSTSVGTNENRFNGTFEGNGHTITFTKETTEQLCAPFLWIVDATIQNLHTTGTITTSNQMAAGIVGRAFGACNFTNCRSSMEIRTSKEGDGSNGGLLAILNNKTSSNGSSTATFTGCIFDGKFISTNSEGTTQNGGMVGCSHYNYVTFTNCLFAPTEVQNMDGGNTCTFSRCDTYTTDTYFTFNNSYYTQAFGRINSGSKQAYTITGVSPVTVAMSGTATPYNVSGITAYSDNSGILYNGTIYAGGNEIVNLTLSGSTTGGYQASEGLLERDGDNYNILMEAANTEISVDPCPQITNLTVSEITNSTAKVSWDKMATAATGDITYQVTWAETGDTPDWTSTYVTSVSDRWDNSNAPWCQAYGLDSETEYVIYVRRVKAQGEYCDVVTTDPFTTLSNCSAPAEMNATNLTANSATLSWTGAQESYNVRYRKLVAGEEVTTTEDFSGNYTLASYNADGVLPEGWVGTKTGSYKPHITNNNTLGGSYDVVGIGGGEGGTDQFMYMGSPSIAILPQYSGITAISFQYAYEGTSNGTLTVGYCTENTDGSSFTALTNSGSSFTPANTSLQTVNLTAEAIALINENNGYLAFKWTGSNWGVGIDNIAITTQSITPDAWNTDNTNVTSPLPISGLEANTTYEWQVQGINNSCGENGLTDWSEMATFNTPYPTFTKTIEAVGNDNWENGKGGYYLIASPLAENVTPNAANGFIVGDYDLYAFDQAEVDEWRNYKDNEFSSIVNGKGYLYASKVGTTLTFTGAPYSSDGEVTLSVAENTDNLGAVNLVGNPFGKDAYINKPFYTLENSDTYTPNEANTAIHAMQGLLVVADEDGETLTFTPAEAPAGSKAKLNMNVSKDRSVVDQAIISFNEGQQLPKLQFRNGSTKVYIPQEGKDYAIVSAESNMGEMPVNFKAEKNGTYTLSFTSEEVSFAYLHLIDNMTGIETDLLQTPSYTFDARTMDYESRFKLVFATGNNANDDNFAFFSNGSFVINNMGEATLQVIDINGRILKSESINGCANVNVKAAAGVYMLRLVNGNDVKVQKVVVR